MPDEFTRSALLNLLEEYREGRRGVADFLDWEAEYSLGQFPVEVREDLDKLALLAEEVVDGMRDETDFDEAVATIIRLARTTQLVVDTEPTPAVSIGTAAETNAIEVPLQTQTEYIYA